MKKTLFTVIASLFCACASSNLPPLKTIEKVELSKYLGVWHEIARFENTFQRGCVATTATYSLKDDGRINVLNKCHKDTATGEEKSAEGVAWVVDTATNAKLKVRFFWPFSGDYWIIDLDPEYKWAVVGEPDRKYLWILARAPEMEQTVYDAIIARLKEQSYDVTLLKKY